MRRRWMGLALVALPALVGCGADSTSPGAALPRSGSYALSVEAVEGPSGATQHLASTLVLTSVSRDSIAGYIALGGDFRAQPFTDGTFNVDAYRIATQVEPGGWAAYIRLAPSGNSLTCQSAVVWWNGPMTSTCAITWSGS